jgi:TM2 domain-containing membrane protein YozV
MINQDEVFVITEDDILKPSDKGKGKGASTSKGPVAVVRAAKAEKSREPEETVVERTPARGTRRASRSPAAAGTLSLFVWGLGQLYNGDVRLAMLFLLGELLVGAFHYLLIMTWDRLRTFAHLFFISEWEMLLYASSIDFCLIFFMIYNVWQAYREAEARGGCFSGLHSPLVAGAASLLIPGWGQMLNGQVGKAVVFLFSFLLQIYLLALYLMSPFYRLVADLDPEKLVLKKAIWVGMAALFATALSWLLSIYDAVLVARYTRRLDD